MKWLLSVSVFLILISQLHAQNARYGPMSTEWLQSGHDYKKTRRAPLKCTSPANVNRIWTSEDSPGNWFSSGGAVYNNTFDWDNNGYVEVSGGGEDCDQWDCDVLWRLHHGGGGIIFQTGYGEEYYTTYWATGYTNTGESRVAMHIENNFKLQRGDGSLIYSVGVGWASDITVADLNNDNCAEIYVQHGSNFRAIDLCANSYSTIWSVYEDGQIIGSAIGFIQNVGSWDIVLSNVNNGNARVVIRNALTGAWKNTINMGTGANYMTLPTLVDIDNDGRDEIIVGYVGETVNGPYSPCEYCSYVCDITTTLNISAYKFNSTVWQYSTSNTTTVPAVYDEWQGYYCPTYYYPSLSHIAVGRILPGNQLGIAYLLSGELYIMSASNGTLIAGPIGSYFGSPSIADMNADGIEGVIVSDECGNPKEHSYVNGWTNPIWSASGCADEPPITSDLIISKWYMFGNPPTGKLMIVEGDVSCYTNVWHCESAEMITPVDVSETNIQPTVKYQNGSIKILNYIGNVEIYDIAGRKLISDRVENEKRFEIKKEGIYIVRLDSKQFKVLVSGR